MRSFFAQLSFQFPLQKKNELYRNYHFRREIGIFTILNIKKYKFCRAKIIQ